MRLVGLTTFLLSAAAGETLANPTEEAACAFFARAIFEDVEQRGGVVVDFLPTEVSEEDFELVREDLERYQVFQTDDRFATLQERAPSGERTALSAKALCLVDYIDRVVLQVGLVAGERIGERIMVEIVQNGKSLSVPVLIQETIARRMIPTHGKY